MTATKFNAELPGIDSREPAVAQRLTVLKPHILKPKGGSWSVAYLSTVSWLLVKEAIYYRNNFLEKDRLR